MNKFSLFNKTGKFEDAAELFKKAANQYKVAQFWQEAGKAFSRAAECYIHLEQNHDGFLLRLQHILHLLLLLLLHHQRYARPSPHHPPVIICCIASSPGSSSSDSLPFDDGVESVDCTRTFGVDRRLLTVSISCVVSMSSEDDEKSESASGAGLVSMGGGGVSTRAFFRPAV